MQKSYTQGLKVSITQKVRTNGENLYETVLYGGGASKSK